MRLLLLTLATLLLLTPAAAADPFPPRIITVYVAGGYTGYFAAIGAEPDAEFTVTTEPAAELVTLSRGLYCAEDGGQLTCAVTVPDGETWQPQVPISLLLHFDRHPDRITVTQGAHTTTWLPPPPLPSPPPAPAYTTRAWLPLAFR